MIIHAGTNNLPSDSVHSCVSKMENLAVKAHGKGPVIICRRGGGAEDFRGITRFFKRTEGRALRGDQEEKGENYLKRWDQFITFLMILFRHELI